MRWIDDTGTEWMTRTELPVLLGRARSTTYALVKAGEIPMVQNPSECRSWLTYDGQWVTVPGSALAATRSYDAAVVTSKQAQAALARTHVTARHGETDVSGWSPAGPLRSTTPLLAVYQRR